MACKLLSADGPPGRALIITTEPSMVSVPVLIELAVKLTVCDAVPMFKIPVPLTACKATDSEAAEGMISNVPPEMAVVPV